MKKQILLLQKMKSVFIKSIILSFLFLLTPSLFAKSVNQLITLKVNDCTVNDFFRMIKEQTGLSFVYKAQYVKEIPNISLDVKNKTVESVLNLIFSKTAFECSFENNIIYITPRKKVTDKTFLSNQNEKIKISGTVYDEAGEPLPGATILVEGTSIGVSTNTEGKYILLIPNQDKVYLLFTFIGMESKKVLWNGEEELSVWLKAENITLNDVVVIGYGERKKGSITGSVSTVQSDKLEMMPIPTLDQALQGQSAGVQVLGVSGKPGSGATVRIRGVNSITAGTDPLYVMDGVVITSSDFAALNNADIESISVLKDASSTSIYGSRAANGVILITSKRGKHSERAQVNFRAQYGWSALAYGKIDVMNTQERLEYEELIGYNQDNHDWDPADYAHIDIDWRDEIFNNNAPMSSYDFSISGGGEKLAYYISAGYFDQEGIAPNSDFNRYTFKVNLNGRFNNWLSGGSMVTMGFEQNSNVLNSGTSSMNPAIAAYFMLPYWNPYKANGELSSVTDGSFIGSTPNPLEFYEKAGKKNDNYFKIIGSFFLELNPIERLKIKSMLGVDGADLRVTNKGNPSYYTNNGEGSMSEAFVRNYTLTLTNTLTYRFSLGTHNRFNLLLGQEAIQHHGENISATGIGLNDDRMMQLDLVTRPSAVSGGEMAYTYLSWFGRLSYDFSDRYFLDFSVRGDGSSRFGKDNRWATFWSVGAMWKIKEESFLNHIKGIHDARISVSIGTSGNSLIGEYEHLALVDGGNSYVGSSTFVKHNPGNANLSWERLQDVNMTMNLGLWNFLDIEFGFYNKKTTDMLMVVPMPAISGYGSIRDNIGEMRNRGVELTLDFDLIRGRNFTWNVNGNVSYNKNEILSLYNDIPSYSIGNSGVILQVGIPAGALQAVRFAGVNPGNGDALWYDKDGNLTNEYNISDEVVLDGKSQNAPWSGGFTNTFYYKRFTLSMFFNWVKDRYMYNNIRYFIESNGSSVQYNQSPKMFDCWRYEGQETDVPRYGVSSQPDDRFIEDASFLRLKNLMLSYNLPLRWFSDNHFNFRLFAQVQNLFTITKYTGLDPESPANLTFGEYPHTKQFTFGIDVNF